MKYRICFKDVDGQIVYVRDNPGAAKAIHPIYKYCSFTTDIKESVAFDRSVVQKELRALQAYFNGILPFHIEFYTNIVL